MKREAYEQLLSRLGAEVPGAERATPEAAPLAPKATPEPVPNCPDTPEPAGDHEPSRAEAERRAVVFRRLLEAREAGAVPFLRLPGANTTPGACLSCGDPLPAGNEVRCALCVAAAHLALAVPEVRAWMQK